MDSQIRSSFRSQLKAGVASGVLGSTASLLALATAYLADNEPWAYFDWQTNRVIWRGQDYGAITDLPGLIWSRASGKYVPKADGTLQWVEANTVPRSDAGVFPEPAATNVLTYSQDFDNAAWGKLQSGAAIAPIVTSNAGIAPDGTLTADRIQFDLDGNTTSSDVSRIQNNTSVTMSETYTTTFWVRSYDGISEYEMQLQGAGGITSITVTGQWQRVENISAAVGPAITPMLRLRGGQTPATSDTADVLVWQAQCELGAFASSEIPTSGPHVVSPGSSATRAADNGYIDLLTPGLYDVSAQSELVTNGGSGFSGTTGWSEAANTTVSESGGILRVTSDANGPATGTFSYPTTVGKTYLIQIVCSAETQATGSPNFAGTDFPSVALVAGQTHTKFVVASSTSSDINVATGGAALAGEYVEFSSITVKEIPASQIIDYDLTLFEASTRLVDSGAYESLLVLDSGAGDDEAYLQIVHPTDAARMYAETGSTLQAFIDVGSISVGMPFKHAGRIKANDFNAALDGTSGTADVSGTVPARPTRILFAQRNGGANPYIGQTTKTALFNTALADANLEAMTA